MHRPVPLVVVRGFLGCSVVWETGYCRERVALTGTLESDYDACSVCNVCDHPREVLKRFISTFFGDISNSRTNSNETYRYKS